MSPAEILMIIQAARGAIQLANQLIVQMNQRGELSLEDRAKFAAEMELMFAKPHWLPESPPPLTVLPPVKID